MIEGQKDLETGQVDIGGEGLLGSRRKRWKEKKRGRYRNEIVQEKIEQESETGETLTNCRECYNK